LSGFSFFGAFRIYHLQERDPGNCPVLSLMGEVRSYRLSAISYQLFGALGGGGGPFRAARLIADAMPLTSGKPLKSRIGVAVLTEPRASGRRVRGADSC
jgi:hypothetical protein